MQYNWWLTDQWHVIYACLIILVSFTVFYTLLNMRKYLWEWVKISWDDKPYRNTVIAYTVVIIGGLTLGTWLGW